MELFEDCKDKILIGDLEVSSTYNQSWFSPVLSRFSPGSLQVLSSFSSGSLQVLLRFSPGFLRFSPGCLRVLSRFSPGSLQVLLRFSPGSFQFFTNLSPGAHPVLSCFYPVLFYSFLFYWKRTGARKWHTLSNFFPSVIFMCSCAAQERTFLLNKMIFFNWNQSF